jgi:hypothetical protein
MGCSNTNPRIVLVYCIHTPSNCMRSKFGPQCEITCYYCVRSGEELIRPSLLPLVDGRGCGLLGPGYVRRAYCRRLEPADRIKRFRAAGSKELCTSTPDTTKRKAHIRKAYDEAVCRCCLRRQILCIFGLTAKSGDKIGAQHASSHSLGKLCCRFSLGFEESLR